MLRYGSAKLDYVSLIKQAGRLDYSVCNRKCKLALLSDAAPQYLVSIFKTLFHSYQIEAEIYEAGFNTIEPEIYNSNSALYQFNPDYVALIHSSAQLRSRYYAATEKNNFWNQEVTRIKAMWAALTEKTKAQIIQSNFVMPSERPFGNYDLKAGQSFFDSVRRINDDLIESAKENPSVTINDLNYLASHVGIKHWQDEKMWILSKSICAFEYLPLIAQNIVDIVAARMGFGVKCVVLDLDNTLWGGVIAGSSFSF